MRVQISPPAPITVCTKVALMLSLYNTLTRCKEAFTPMTEGLVKMYSCGPTVYAPPHIGNYRSFLFADLVRRYLEYKGFTVVQVMNLTDIDDKTIRDSGKAGISLRAFTEKYEKIFFDGVELLNIEKASTYPRASEHVDDMIRLTEVLLEKGYAYVRNGSVYFDVSKPKDYGKLSRLDLEGLKAGARVESDEYDKESPADFALMKRSTPEEISRGITYQSPWGPVRPGWHIECSVLSTKYLGSSFDIHTGGIDLVFPHHENEIAQSESSTGKRFVNYWLHCQHLLVDGRRMAKSLGNYITMEDLVSKKYDPRAIRLALTSTHYRHELNFTFDALDAAEKTVESLSAFVVRLREVDGEDKTSVDELVESTKKRFEDALDDDLDIRGALTALFDLVGQVNKSLDEDNVGRKGAGRLLELVQSLDKVLGLQLAKPQTADLSEEVEGLIADREAARKNKNWATADKIRKQLEGMGVLLEDTSKGVRWKLAKKTG